MLDLKIKNRLKAEVGFYNFNYVYPTPAGNYSRMSLLSALE